MRCLTGSQHHLSKLDLNGLVVLETYRHLDTTREDRLLIGYCDPKNKSVKVRPMYIEITTTWLSGELPNATQYGGDLLQSKQLQVTQYFYQQLRCALEEKPNVLGFSLNMQEFEGEITPSAFVQGFSEHPSVIQLCNAYGYNCIKVTNQNMLGIEKKNQVAM
jgi:hypothetical protein